MRAYIKGLMDQGTPATQARNVPWSVQRKFKRYPKKSADMAAALEELRTRWQLKTDAAGNRVWTAETDHALDLLIKEIKAGFYEGRNIY
jgi:hypothetical protein